MLQHVQQTIADLENKIVNLDLLVHHLKVHFADSIPPSIPGHGAPISPISPIPSKPTRRAPTAPSKKTPRRSDAGARNAAICAGLPQPFTSISLAKALSLTKNGGSSQITRWMAIGLVKRVGFGQYERTAKFPGSPRRSPTEAGQLPHSTPIPGLDPEPKGTIAEQLEKALKDRDTAKAAGQDRLAKILQDKVDKLTSQLT
jgi:hypothetical protein